MAISVVSSLAGQGQHSFTVSLGISSMSKAAGDTIVVVTAGDGVSADCVIHNISFVELASVEPATYTVDNTGNVAVSVFVFPNISSTIASTANTVSVHPPGGGAGVVGCYVIRGLNPTVYVDQTNGATGSGTEPSSGSITTTQATEILIGVVGSEGVLTDEAGTWGTDIDQNQLRQACPSGGSATGHITLSSAAEIKSATGTYTASKTGMGNRDWAALVISLFGVEPSSSVSPSVSPSISPSSSPSPSLSPSASPSPSSGGVSESASVSPSNSESPSVSSSVSPSPSPSVSPSSSESRSASSSASPSESPSVSPSSSASPSVSPSVSPSISPSSSLSPSSSESPSLSPSESLSPSSSESASPSPSGPAASNLKYWDGAQWVTVEFKVYLGGSWQIKPLKYWNGSQWVDI